ncbi:MAG: TrlF family AAA-like ATPase [Myxococcota bacterium]
MLDRLAWPYPGSRWWKFDFHTHTPASLDTRAWQQAKGSPDEVTAEKWLQKYMQAGLDCVAVTDHNSGAWIDQLKEVYAKMKEASDQGSPPASFRALTLFPGVELSVSGGFHLLAIFDPTATTRTVTDLLSAVGYDGTDGDSDGVTRSGPVDVVEKVLKAGGIPIPAHADADKGLLQVSSGTHSCARDPQTVRQVMNIEDLLALEWTDSSSPPPTYTKTQFDQMAKVIGSDCHSFQGHAVPGSRFTWIKMALPTIEGLRLALLDGNDVSVRRSDEGEFDPLSTPEHFITRIEIGNARHMGNGGPECLEMTPYCNSLIGGRGTGKSTIVHAMRLAFDRGQELHDLADNTEPQERFQSFAKVGKNGDGGAVRRETKIRVELIRDGVKYRLSWDNAAASGIEVERQDGDGWKVADDQSVTSQRFPIRLFSQGQIAAIAGNGRQALVGLIDEASHADEDAKRLSEAKKAYFSKRAKLRELDERLARRPEFQTKLHDLDRKLEAFEASDHSETLKAYQVRIRQQQIVDNAIQRLKSLPARITEAQERLVYPDWPSDAFDSIGDKDIIEFQRDSERVIAEAREALEKAADGLRTRVLEVPGDQRIVTWKSRVERARTAYNELQSMLQQQGVSDPNAFERIAHERQTVVGKLQELEALEVERNNVESAADSSWSNVREIRDEIKNKRQRFVEESLAGNRFVKIAVVKLYPLDEPMAA